MHTFSVSHLSNASLDRALEAAARDDVTATAWLLAHLAESEARRRYLPAGFPSMFAYCVRHLRFSEDAACKRLRVARAARCFPAIYRLIAQQRLHLTGALLLAPHLTTENAAELIEAACDRTKSEIELLIASKFPQADVPDCLQALASAAPARTREEVHDLSAPERIGMTKTERPASQSLDPTSADAMPPPVEPGASGSETAPARVEVSPAARLVPATESRARIAPLAPERFALQCTVSKRTHDQLQRAKELLRHAVPDGNLDAVLGRALDLLVEKLEQRKFAATDQPRSAANGPAKPRPGANPRYIPAAVKRAVRERDGGRCTFVSATGHRCDARSLLEYDHEIPFARGGGATVGNLRLRCRAHNQHEAERTFGAERMRHKRESAAAARATPARAAATG